MSTENTTAPVNNSHPSALYFIFWGEFAERCSYYGMRAILMLYMVNALKIDKADASSYYFIFKMCCYLLPLLGGYLADRYFGRYWTIVGFTIPYVFGQILLCFQDTTFLFLALILLAGGSGVIKPNISSLLGMTYDQRRPGNLSLRAKAFLWFYFSINIGALLSQAGLPFVRDHYGYQVAFAIPAVLMVGALIAFAIGRPFYAKETPGVKPVLTEEQKLEQRKVIVSLLGVFLLIVLFWLPYEHNDTQWILFAKDHMNLNTPWLTTLGGPDKLSPDAFQWANSLMVVLLLPFFQWFWPKVDPTGKRISPIRKMFIGFLFTASAPFVMTFCAYMTQHGMEMSYWWLILAYMLLTIGEVLVYGTGLDFSYGQAPSNMKSMITACFLLTNAIANLINICWTRAYENDVGKVFQFSADKAAEFKVGWFVTPFQFYTIDTVLPLIGAMAILYVGRRFHVDHGKV